MTSYSQRRHLQLDSPPDLHQLYCAVLQGWLSLGLSAICLIWQGNRSSIEERMLVRQFGDDYREYCK